MTTMSSVPLGMQPVGLRDALGRGFEWGSVDMEVEHGRPVRASAVQKSSGKRISFIPGPHVDDRWEKAS